MFGSYTPAVGGPSGSDEIPYYRAWGSHYCKDGETCLSSLTINDIYEICYYYKDKPDTYKYAIQFVFKN